MDLYLVRHAIAEERDPLRWPDDRQRPLSEDGLVKFEAAARGLRRVVPEVEVLLSSPLVRARQTAAILVERTGWPVPRIIEAAAPETTPEETIGALRAFSGTRSLAIVGHEPHLSALTTLLIAGDAAVPAVQFRKGGIALIKLAQDPRPAGGTLRWLLPPKLLRLLGGLAT